MQFSENTKKDVYIVIVAGVFFAIGLSIIFLLSHETSKGYIRAVDSKKILLEELIINEQVQKAVKAANIMHASLLPREIEALDIAWREQGNVSQIARKIEQTEASEQLKLFHLENEEFVEIFITDKYGLNVAQTNKTSDYYQADEVWWQRTYAGGEGRLFIDDIEYDESARVWVVPIYMPIFSEAGVAEGVVKALVDSSKLR